VLTNAYRRSLEKRVSQNKQILENPYFFLPIDDKGHESWTPAGRDEKSSDFCAKFVKVFKGCKNFGKHESGGMHVRLKHWWCHKVGCCVCWLRGFAVRGARSITGRLEAGVDKGFGKIEHISVSVPRDDYDLPVKVLKRKCWDALVDRGVVGGCMIPHGFRIDRVRRVLGWSFHVHFLGFFEGEGFDRCRNCVHSFNDCRSCDGVKGREVRGFAKDGYLVKVHEERETVHGSAWYFLTHVTVKRSFLRRWHAWSYWGECANRKYSATVPLSEDKCWECGEEMGDFYYDGKEPIVTDVGDVEYKACFTVSRAESENFVEVVGHRGFRGFG